MFVKMVIFSTCILHADNQNPKIRAENNVLYKLQNCSIHPYRYRFFHCTLTFKNEFYCVVKFYSSYNKEHDQRACIYAFIPPQFNLKNIFHAKGPITLNWTIKAGENQLESQFGPEFQSIVFRRH